MAVIIETMGMQITEKKTEKSKDLLCVRLKHKTFMEDKWSSREATKYII